MKIGRKKHFAEKTFVGDSKIAKFVKIFSLEKFPHNHMHIYMYMYTHMYRPA